MHAIIKTLVVAIVFTLMACGNESNKTTDKVAYVSPNYSGHYLIETFVLDGDCEALPAFQMILWGDNIYENVADEYLNITGNLAGDELTGIVDFETGEQAVFDAMMVNSKTISGDWYLTDGTCIGYLTGTRITE